MGKITKTTTTNIDVETEQDWVEICLPYIEQFENEAYSLYIPLMEERIDRVIREAIASYYSDSPRHMYQPTGTLYSAYELSLIKGGRDIGLHIGADIMDRGHRVDEIDEEYIYNYMFVKGYHGGPLIPYPRKGGPKQYDGENGKPWSEKIKYRLIPAEQSEKSPYDIINEQRLSISQEYMAKIGEYIVKKCNALLK